MAVFEVLVLLLITVYTKRLAFAIQGLCTRSHIGKKIRHLALFISSGLSWASSSTKLVMLVLVELHQPSGRDRGTTVSSVAVLIVAFGLVFVGLGIREC